MKRIVMAVLLLFAFVVPMAGKTHKEIYNVPCGTLWPAVKDVLRNSGKYGIIGIDSTEMTASYNIGGSLGGKRINSLVLNTQGTNCEMQVQTAFSGLAHDDAGDFKKRVDEALAKQQAAAAAAAPATQAAQPAPAQPVAPAAPATQPTPAEPPKK
jgi:hypothetical protein